MKADYRPTEAMLAMLRNVNAGRHIAFGLYGRSAIGGATTTIKALHRHGYLAFGCVITQKGLDAISDAPIPTMTTGPTGIQLP